MINQDFLLGFASGKAAGGSGGPSIDVEALSVTANGTYTAPSGKAYSPVTVNVSGGGGSSNVVMGMFTTGTTEGVAETLTIPYNGNGYLIEITIYPEGGAYNSETAFYNAIKRSAIAVFNAVKCDTTTAPKWSNTGIIADQCTLMYEFKNSTSNATVYSRGSSPNARAFRTGDADGGADAIRFSSENTLSYYITNGESGYYGLLAGTQYRYVAVYSS